MPTVILSIGSNAGNSQREIRTALEKLGGMGTLTGISPVYRTEPMGYRDQNWFLNLAVSLVTRHPLREVAARLAAIEKGKKSHFLNGPRKLDLDILFYDDLVFHGRDIRIPHVRLETRRFVMEPLARLAPRFIHPGYNLPLKELYRRFWPRFRNQKVAQVAPCPN